MVVFPTEVTLHTVMIKCEIFCHTIHQSFIHSVGLKFKYMYFPSFPKVKIIRIYVKIEKVWLLVFQQIAIVQNSWNFRNIDMEYQ